MINRCLNLPKYIDKKQSLFIFGPRGVGKSYLVNRSIPEGSFNISLLDPSTLQWYLANPSLLTREVTTRIKSLEAKGFLTVAIDEIQKLPGLLDEVHALIEAYKGAVCFILTGSSARKLRRSGANLLAGRALTTYLHPISFCETELDLDTVLKIGSLPAVYFDPEFAHQRLRSYIGTYLKEEIKEESLVRKIDRFARFLDLAGQLNSEPINHSKLAKTLKTTPNTVQEYFSILVDTLLCLRIDGWAHSVKKQLLQAPRYYWFDCGVLNALNGELETETKRSSFRYGKLFETLMIQEIARFNDYFERGFRFFYWRDQTGNEIDLLIAKNSSSPIAAIEFKSSESPTDDDFSGFTPFHQDYPKVPRFCFSTCPRAYELPSGVLVLPWREGLEMLKTMGKK